jgi:hypothetical protein
MLAKGGFQLGRVERLKQGAHGVDGWCTTQGGAERRVEALTMHHDEHQQAAVGGGVRQNGQHREQQQMSERVAPTLSATLVRDLFQGGEQASERHHGRLQQRHGAGQPRTPGDDSSGSKPPSRAVHHQNRTALFYTLRTAIPYTLRNS